MNVNCLWREIAMLSFWVAQCPVSTDSLGEFDSSVVFYVFSKSKSLSKSIFWVLQTIRFSSIFIRYQFGFIALIRKHDTSWVFNTSLQFHRIVSLKVNVILLLSFRRWFTFRRVNINTHVTPLSAEDNAGLFNGFRSRESGVFRNIWQYIILPDEFSESWVI